jgi:prepilin-type N-terminal cleavage/methylation domain-containing protein
MPKGYTLFELIVVLAVVGIAATVVLPRLGFSTSVRLQAEVREVQSLLQYAQRQALLQGTTVQVALYSLSDDKEQGQVDPQVSNGETNLDTHFEQGVIATSLDSGTPTLEKPLVWASNDIKMAFRDALSDRLFPVNSLIFEFFPTGGSSGGLLMLQMDERRSFINLNPITGRQILLTEGEVQEQLYSN